MQLTDYPLTKPVRPYAFVPLNLEKIRIRRHAAPKRNMTAMKLFVVDDYDSTNTLPPALWRAGVRGEVYRRVHSHVFKRSAWRSLLRDATDEQTVRYLNNDPLDLRRANLELVACDAYKGARPIDVGSVISTLDGYEEALESLSFDAPLHVRSARTKMAWVVARSVGSPMTPDIVSKLLHWYTDPFLSNELPEKHPHNELPMGVDMDFVQEYLANEFGIRGYCAEQLRRILNGKALKIAAHDEQYWKAARLLPNAVTRGFITAQKRAALRGDAPLSPEDWREKKREQMEAKLAADQLRGYENY